MSMTDAENGVRLDVESLRVFREVVAADGFTAAGDRLGITQSAVSHKIRRLEERLGFELIARDGGAFTLTDDGRDLLGHAEEIVRAHDHAVDHLRRSSLVGEVRLGCNEEVAATELAEVAGRFRRTHPDIRLEIRVHDSAYVAEWLAAGEIDLALIQVLDVDGAIRDVDQVWRRDSLQVVQGDGADFSDLDSLPLISFGPRCLYEPFLAAALDAAGRPFHHAMECPSIQGVQAAVEAGIGVAVLNTPNVTDSMRAYNDVADLELPAVAFVMRTGTESADPEAVAALGGHLRAALERTGQP